MRHHSFVAIAVLMCVASSIVSSDDSSTVDESVKFDAREFVKQVLASELTPEARMKALEPYIDVGRSGDDVEKVLGRFSLAIGHGPGFTIAEYGELGKPGLSIHYYPNGEVCSISYRSKDGQSTVLRSDDPITWPKTKTGKNAQLRQKK